MEAIETLVPERRSQGPAGPGSERHLLAALLDRGDTIAAEELARQTYPRVFATLLRFCGQRELAADLTQETYRRAWSSLDQFRRGSSFYTWLFRIATNVFLNHQRRPSRLQPMTETTRETLADPSPDGADRTLKKQERQQLRRVVLELPSELRLVVTAKFWGEVKTRDLARLEGLSHSAIRKRLKRALEEIQKRLVTTDSKSETET